MHFFRYRVEGSSLKISKFIRIVKGCFFIFVSRNDKGNFFTVERNFLFRLF